MSLRHPFIAQGVARVYLDLVYRLHGAPQVLLFDRDKIFISISFWNELMDDLGTKVHLSSTYHQ